MDNIQNNTNMQDINLIKQVTTLVVEVKNLKDSQDNFHREVKESFKELQSNYSSKLDNHETRITALEVASIPKISQDDFKNKVGKIEKTSSNFWIYLTLYSLALGGLYVLMVAHILMK
jgi:RNAse (barnase) inhibitor barstar